MKTKPKKPIILKKFNTKVMKTQDKIVGKNAAVANNKKKIVSLEEIGIKVLPFKGHLSSFRIPKLNKALEVTKDKSWKLETYSEAVNETQHSNKSNEIGKYYDKEKCVLSLKKKEDKSLHQYEEKKPESKCHKDFALKQKREESKLSDKNKITANKTKESVACFEEKKIDEEMAHQHKEKTAKRTKENTKIFESELKETNQHIRYMEDTPQNSQDKTQKEISLHNNADGPHGSKGDVSENNSFVKEALQICKNSKNTPAKDTNLKKLNEIKEVESQEEVATSKNKIKSITHKRKLFSPDMCILEENYDNDANNNSDRNNDNLEINNKQKVNEKLQEIVQECINKNSNSGSSKCNRTKSDSEDDSCHATQISASLISRRKSINLQRRILDSNSDEEIKKIYLKSAHSSQVISQDSQSSSLRTLKSLKARRKSVNLQRRIYDSSCDEDNEVNIKEQDKSSELQTAASTNMNEKQIQKEDISSEGSNLPAIPIKSLKIHKKTTTKEHNLKKYGNTEDNKVKHLESQHIATCNKDEVATNRPTVTAIRIRRKSMMQERGCLNIQQEEREIENNMQLQTQYSIDRSRQNVIKCNEEMETTKQSDIPLKIRRKSMYQESHTSNAQLAEREIVNVQSENSVNKTQLDIINLNKERRDENSARLKPITSLKMRRMSMYDVRVTTKIQEVSEIDNKQLLETESSIDKNQLQVINSNKEQIFTNLPPKTTPSLKRRKSMYQESVTVNIQEEDTKRDNQEPVLQSRKVNSQVELTICYKEIEDTKHPPKKSIKMRRKSMYQESGTFNNHQKRVKYNKYDDIESKSTSNKEKEVIKKPALKMRRKSVHQERTIHYDEKKNEHQNRQKTKLETQNATQIFQFDNKSISLRLDTNLLADTQHKTDSNFNTVSNKNKEADSNKNSVKTNINQFCTLDSSSRDSQPLNQTQSVVQNVESTPSPHTKTKPRKRRVVKVLSTSREESPSSVKNLQIQSNTTQVPFTPPLKSPTLSHPIFTTDVTQQQSDVYPILPPTPNKHYDDKFKEIDSKLHEIFQSPQYMLDYKTTTHPLDATNVSSTALILNESKPDITVDETIVCNQENAESFINTSKLNDSINDASSHNHSEIKHLVLGSSEYRFEKISDNVVNLFISRKRKRKRTN